jgi:5-methyltetrahydrofolate--homocysteine methyltransferase
MQGGLGLIKARMVGRQPDSRGKVVIGTVKGDLHDIGKNLVAMMLQGNGFDVIDLGNDVKPEQFVTAVREHQPDFVMMSALLTTTMLSMRETIEALKGAGLRGSVRVAVGGAPLTQRFCEEIGADFYSPNATGAVSQAKALLAA